MKKVLFITAASAGSVPLIVDIASLLSAKLSDPASAAEGIEIISSASLGAHLSDIAATPDLFFIVIPAMGHSENRKCIVCGPQMTHAFSDGLGPATGIMLHVNAKWSDAQKAALANQLKSWLLKMTDPNKPILMPWGKPPVRKPMPRFGKRAKPWVSGVPTSGGGSPLKAERLWA